MAAEEGSAGTLPGSNPRQRKRHHGLGGPAESDSALQLASQAPWWVSWITPTHHRPLPAPPGQPAPSHPPRSSGLTGERPSDVQGPPRRREPWGRATGPAAARPAAARPSLPQVPLGPTLSPARGSPRGPKRQRPRRPKGTEPWARTQVRPQAPDTDEVAAARGCAVKEVDPHRGGGGRRTPGLQGPVPLDAGAAGPRLTRSGRSSLSSRRRSSRRSARPR